MDYASLLNRARKGMPASVLERERFEVPKVRGHLQGNKTLISNFLQIASAIIRDPEHLLKYVLKELAAPGMIQRGMLLIGTKVPASRINEKIRKYVEEFVLCNECGKPDSKIISEGGFLYLRCQVCGSKRIVKAKV